MKKITGGEQRRCRHFECGLPPPPPPLLKNLLSKALPMHVLKFGDDIDVDIQLIFSKNGGHIKERSRVYSEDTVGSLQLPKFKKWCFIFYFLKEEF
jgi:hypothetical protein